MSELPKQRPMTVDEFLTWSETEPGRHELVNGRVFAMAPERVRHTRAKFATSMALLRAIEKAGLPCEVLPDGATVRIDATTAYEPDALVRCGAALDGDLIEVPDPIVVVEVLSPSTRTIDTGAKLAGYFMIASLRHYLIIDGERRLVVHHRRSDGDTIATRVIGFGAIRLDPPGIEISCEDMVGRAAVSPRVQDL